MLALLSLIAALVCFVVTALQEANLIALGLAFVALALLFNHKLVAGRVP
jgi:hypothetical protein